MKKKILTKSFPPILMTTKMPTSIEVNGIKFVPSKPDVRKECICDPTDKSDIPTWGHANYCPLKQEKPKCSCHCHHKQYRAGVIWECACEVKSCEHCQEPKRIPVKDWEGYEIDESGRVFSCREGSNQWRLAYNDWRQIYPWMDKSGYLALTLRAPGRRRVIKLHRLLALNFIPNPDQKPFVCHRDGNPLNNDLDNLYWGTPKENSADAIRHGTAGGKKKAQPEPEVREEVIREAISDLLAHERKQTIEHVRTIIDKYKMEEIPGNIGIYKHQDYAYKAGHNNALLVLRVHLGDELDELLNELESKND